MEGDEVRVLVRVDGGHGWMLRPHVWASATPLDQAVLVQVGVLDTGTAQKLDQVSRPVRRAEDLPIRSDAATARLRGRIHNNRGGSHTVSVHLPRGPRTRTPLPTEPRYDVPTR